MRALTAQRGALALEKPPPDWILHTLSIVQRLQIRLVVPFSGIIRFWNRGARGLVLLNRVLDMELERARDGKRHLPEAVPVLAGIRGAR